MKYRGQSAENANVYIPSNGEKQINFREVMIYNVVFDPISSRVVLPLHSTPFPRVLEDHFYNEIPFLASTTCVLLYMINY